MLFTPDSIVNARRTLFAEMEAGKLTREQAFQEALELDPFDAVALMVLGEARQAAGDLAGAAEYFWRVASADPCRFEPWFQLGVCLPGENPALYEGILELAALKTLRNPEGLEKFQDTFNGKPAAADFVNGEEFLEHTAEQFGEKRRDEPEEVSERLRPHRLVDDLLETAADGLEQELVDGILEDGARCLPLLVGVLRAMVTGSLPGDNTPPAVCSLALLGEIGDPAVLPELIECSTVNDEDIQGAAHWAVTRIAARRTDESLDALRKLALASNAAERSILAIVLNYFPKQAAKRDFLVSLLDGLAAFPKSDRHELFMSVALGLGIEEGTEGLELAWSLLSRHAGLLPKRTRAELREAMRLRAELDRIGPGPAGEAPEETVYDWCCQAWEEEDGEEDEGGEGDPDDNLFDGEDDEDQPENQVENEDFIVEPVRRRGNRGRNDPCWCGSGKKYKKCHLEADEKSIQAPPPPKAPQEKAPPVGNNAEETELRRRLIEFAVGALRKREVEESLRTFLGMEPLAGGDGDTMSREALDWIVHDYVSPRLGHTLIEEFLKRSPGGLTMRQRKILEIWGRARFSLFEVQAVHEGSGVRLTDLLAGGELFVNDVNTSKWAVRWDCFLARVEEFDGSYSFTAMVISIPQPLVAPLKDWANQARERSGLSWTVFLRTYSHKLRQESSRLIKRGAGPTQIVSFEGDELVFSRARYAVVNEEAVRRVLDQSGAFLGDEDAAGYGWLDEAEDANGARRAYGHVHIGGGELTLECSTRQRLERGKELLRNLVGEHLRHLDDRFKTLEGALRDSKASTSPPKGSGLPPEVERKLVQKVLDDHYRNWPDMPLPALDGKSPREATATREGRAQLTDLLKEFENREEHKRRDGLAWYDVSKVKIELGIDW